METRWYLWAVNDDPVTNKYFVNIIGEQNPEYLGNERCADGKNRNLFRCPVGYTNVQSALSAISEFNLKVEVFKEDIDGVIVRYDLWKKSAKKAARRSVVNRKVRSHAS